MDRLSEGIRQGSPRMDELDAFVHQSSTLSPGGSGQSAETVELCVLCGYWGGGCQDGTAILTRAIPGRFSLTPPVLPEGVLGIQCALSGFSSDTSVLHGRPESVRQE